MHDTAVSRNFVENNDCNSEKWNKINEQNMCIYFAHSSIFIRVTLPVQNISSQRHVRLMFMFSIAASFCTHGFMILSLTFITRGDFVITVTVGRT